MREVLIVEPSTTLRRIYAKRCASFGLAPVHVESTVEALDYVAHHRPVAILASLEIGGFTGASLVAALKSSRSFAAIPFVILTSHEKAESYFRFYRPDLLVRKQGDMLDSLDRFFGCLGMAVTEDDAAHPLHDVRILVAEDSHVQQRFVAQVLHVAGANVDLAGDGEEALDMAAVGEYDVIVLDIEMPRLTGIEAAIQMHAAGVRAPLIALTAFAELDELVREANEAGFAEIAGKPIEREDLIDLCLRHLRA